MQISGIPSLEFYDRDFEYSGKKYLYKDVRTVVFSASITRNSVNGIPAGMTYAGRLRIGIDSSYIEIVPTKGIFGKLKVEGLDALQHANAILSDLTFNVRIAKFETQIKNSDFFSYSDFQFHKSGKIVRQGREVANIRDSETNLSLSPFILTIGKRSKSFSQRIVSALLSKDVRIDLTSDHDCIIPTARSIDLCPASGGD